jgi:hypothetical protein
MAEKEKESAIEQLKKASPEELRELLARAGFTVPTTQGFTPESFQTIMASMQALSAGAVKETLRHERKENPNYPEKSVFFPRGKFDDLGNALAPKLTFTRPTIFNGVRLGGELETEDEIKLCNQFTADRSSRDGLWTAILEHQGTSRERLLITVPSLSIDERMSLPPFTLILAELLNGAEAVNPLTMQTQIDALKAEVDRLKQTSAA